MHFISSDTCYHQYSFFGSGIEYPTAEDPAYTDIVIQIVNPSRIGTRTSGLSLLSLVSLVVCHKLFHIIYTISIDTYTQ
jgi:hypothetical protein